MLSAPNFNTERTQAEKSDGVTGLFALGVGMVTKDRRSVSFKVKGTRDSSVFGKTDFDDRQPTNHHLMPSDHQPQMLEVDDAEQRQKRLRTCFRFPSFLLSNVSLFFFFLWPAEAIFERLNGNGEGPSIAEPPNLSFDFGVRRTFAMEPPTERTRLPYPLPKLTRR